MFENMIIITAEIGINHNGDLNIVKKLIDMAVDSGCNAVKFQKRTVEKVYSKSVLDSSRESPWGTTTREQTKGLELSLIDSIINLEKLGSCPTKHIDSYLLFCFCTNFNKKRGDPPYIPFSRIKGQFQLPVSIASFIVIFALNAVEEIIKSGNLFIDSRYDPIILDSLQPVLLIFLS